MLISVKFMLMLAGVGSIFPAASTKAKVKDTVPPPTKVGSSVNKVGL